MIEVSGMGPGVHVLFEESCFELIVEGLRLALVP